MKYGMISIILVTVMICLIIKWRTDRKTENKLDLVESDDKMIKKGGQGSVFQIEELPVDMLPQDTPLIEISDDKLLARIDNLIPELARAGVAARNATRVLQGEVVYRAIIPADAKLAKSNDMDGAFRGIFHNGNGKIGGQANWAPVDRTGEAVANTAAAAMGVAAMIVGQYYMAQINADLSKIGEGIGRIEEFQDNEYKSRVFALIVQIKKITSFQMEILENDEQRLTEIIHLTKLQDQCIELLGQANATLSGFTELGDLDYDVYESKLINAQKWYVYQHTLQETLFKIADLEYTLYMGRVHREQCMSLPLTYTKQISDVQVKLTTWHDYNIKRFGLDIAENKRKRLGIEGAVFAIPGIFDDQFHYKAISKNTADIIETQRKGNIDHHSYTSELYGRDVELILRDGKLYYLPKEVN